jgi:hypothetical protein
MLILSQILACLLRGITFFNGQNRQSKIGIDILNLIKKGQQSYKI